MKLTKSTNARTKTKQIEDPSIIYKGIFVNIPIDVNQFLSKRMLANPLAMVYSNRVEINIHNNKLTKNPNPIKTDFFPLKLSFARK